MDGSSLYSLNAFWLSIFLSNLKRCCLMLLVETVPSAAVAMTAERASDLLMQLMVL